MKDSWSTVPECFGLAFSSSFSLARTNSFSFENKIIQDEIIKWRYHQRWDEFSEPWIKAGHNQEFQDWGSDKPPENQGQQVLESWPRVILFALEGPLMVSQIIESCGNRSRDEVSNKDWGDRSKEKQEDYVVNEEGGDANNCPPEHAPIEMPLEKSLHRLKLSVSLISTLK